MLELENLFCGWKIRHDAHEVHIFDHLAGKCGGWDVK